MIDRLRQEERVWSAAHSGQPRFEPISAAMSAILLICRVLHIAATCTSLGGLFYARMVLWPTLPQLSATEREPFFREMVRRYAIIKWFGIGIISVTGAIQWLYLWPLVTNRPAYLFYFGIKMAAAAGLLSITALLALPDVRVARMQTNRGFWSAMNIACGLTVLIGAALMRTVIKLP